MMKPLAASIAGAIAASLITLHAQTPRSAMQAVPPPTGTAALAGVVKDPDGAPVRRATVTIQGDMRLDRMTVADDEGRFAFASLPSGRFTVTAEKAGYPARSYGAKQPYRTGSGVLLEDGQNVTDLVLTLAKGGAIAGTVFDERGQPMSGVPIMAWEIRTSLAGERTLGFAGPETVTVITDDRGMYRVYGLPPGVYTIGTSWYYDGGLPLRVPTDAEIRAAFESRQAPRSASPSPSPLPDPPRFSHSPSFIPGVVDPMSAGTVTLAAGEVREGVDLRMQFLPMSEIVGTITAADGGAIDVELTIARQGAVEALNTMQVRPAQTESKFSSGNLSPGPYRVAAQSDATPTRPALWAAADVMVSGGQPASVSLVLQPALTVTGKVLFESTTLTPPKDPAHIAVNLRAMGPDDVSTESKTDAAGSVAITGVIPGPYVVSASISGGPPIGPWWIVKSVILDGRDVTDKPFSIDASNAQGLVVTFTDVSAELSGTLTTPSGAPAPDYFLIVMPADRTFWSKRTRRITSVRPDRAGRYIFRRMPAGEYLVAVTTDLVPDDLRDLNAIERLAADGVRVTIGAGEQKTLNLQTKAPGVRSIAAPASVSTARTPFRGAIPRASSRR